MNHCQVQNKSVSLHAAHVGSGELVLMLHGFPESWMSWRPMLIDLGANYLAVAPDNRGFNLSDRPSALSDYGLGPVMGDILALARQFGAGPDRPFHLVGHDWGGIVSWAFAAEQPKWVKSLCVLNAPHPALLQHALNHNAAQHARSAYLLRLTDAAAEERIGEMGVANFWNAIFAEQVARKLISDADRASYIRAWSQPRAITSMLNWYRASPFTYPDQIFAPLAGAENPFSSMHIEVPTLVIWGMQDALLGSELLDDLDKYVRDLRIERLPNAGHGLLHDSSVQILALLRDFLARA